MSQRSKLWILAVCGLVFIQAGASFVLPRGFGLTALSDITQCLLLICGTASLLPNVLSSHGRTKLFWALMSLGLAFWLAYQLLWTYIEVFLRRDVPNPFVGDVVIFLHIVPMIAALAMQPHAEQDERTVRLGSLDFALLAVWWLYLYIYTVIPWQYAITLDTQYEHNLNAVYLTEKLVFLAAIAAAWWRSKGGWRTVYAHWFGASLTYALSSYVANWGIEHRVYYSGSLYDVPLAVSMAWVTVIGAIASDSTFKPAAAPRSHSQAVWVARIAMIAIFSLPLFAVLSVFEGNTPPRIRSFRLIVTLAGMVVMGVMVFLKQHLLDRELLRLLRSSQRSFEDLQRLQGQLIQSEKLASLGQLVGGAAHELNNPLTAMLGYSELLCATPLDNQQRALADNIGKQVRRTKALVSSLLSFAKQVPGEKTMLDLNSVVQTALKLCQPQIRVLNVEVRSEFAADLPRVMGDSNQLLQVCVHIINNALHVIPGSGGMLEMCTRQEDGRVVLEISDNGPGAEAPEKVFDPFYTTRPVGQGTGLGLSACYGMIQEHNGVISCRNRPQGGATFRIELVAAAKAATAN